MKNLIILVFSFSLWGCFANKPTNLPNEFSPDVVKLKFINYSPKDTDSAAKNYFDCVMELSALKEALHNESFENSNKNDVIDFVIAECAPAARKYAKFRILEMDSLNPDQLEKNVLEFGLPEIESATRARLNELIFQ